MRITRLLAVGLALLAVATVSISNAAALDVQALSLTSFSGSADCTTATLTVSSTNVTGNRTSTLLVSNVPAACRSQAMQLTVYDLGGGALATSTTTTTAAGVTTTVTLSTSVLLNKVVGIALTIGARGIATTWAG
jgi:hypothetical protein